MREKRGQWYLLTGLVLGLTIGLIISLVIAPSKFNYASPHSLGEEYKAEYRSLIALAYNADQDIGRAKARLSLLQDANPGAVFSAQAQRVLASGGDVMEANALSILGKVLTKQENNTPKSTALPEASPTTP
jgi:gas vesicle protein